MNKKIALLLGNILMLTIQHLELQNQMNNFENTHRQFQQSMKNDLAHINSRLDTLQYKISKFFKMVLFYR